MGIRLPDFIIIGAMKCATSTLHEQLAAQPGIFMSTPKEPNFFSDDAVFAQGMDWYASLFRDVPEDAVCGESSTHYTKLPNYPHCVRRMREQVPDAKLIYCMRHPIDRLVSHYIHEWTMNVLSSSIDDALDACPDLIAYSRYSMQLEPFLNAYGPENILPVFMERLNAEPLEQLQRVCRHIGYGAVPVWREQLAEQNVSRDRLRASPLRDAIVYAPVISTIRRTLIPKSVRARLKSLWQMRERPELSTRNVDRLKSLFDEDLATLGRWFGVGMSCDTFNEVVANRDLEWTSAVGSMRA